MAQNRHNTSTDAYRAATKGSGQTFLSKPLKIRRAGVQDIPKIMEMKSDFNAHDNPPFQPEPIQRALRELLKRKGLGLVWLLEAANQSVGFLILTFSFSLEFHGRCAFVDEFYIRPKFRGKGIGATALEFAIGDCARRGILTIHLEIERASPRARSLYERHGFEDRGFYLMSRWIDVK